MVLPRRQLEKEDKKKRFRLAPTFAYVCTFYQDFHRLEQKFLRVSSR
jgi:hypothetical protein